MKKGDRITITGQGRTGHWPKNTVGEVTRKSGDRVFVLFDGSRWIEHEMDIKEVKVL